MKETVEVAWVHLFSPTTEARRMESLQLRSNNLESMAGASLDYVDSMLLLNYLCCQQQESIRFGSSLIEDAYAYAPPAGRLVVVPGGIACTSPVNQPAACKF